MSSVLGPNSPGLVGKSPKQQKSGLILAIISKLKKKPSDKSKGRSEAAKRMSYGE